MITEIDTNIPQSTNDRVIDSLMNAEGWYFGKDHTNNNFKNQSEDIVDGKIIADSSSGIVVTEDDFFPGILKSPF